MWAPYCTGAGHAERETPASAPHFAQRRGMRAMFRDGQDCGVGRSEHLPRGMTSGHRLVQGSAAPPGRSQEMIDHWHRAFRFKLNVLRDGLSARRRSALTISRKLLTPRGLLFQPITGWRFSAIAAVQPKLTFAAPRSAHSAPLSRLATRRFLPVVPRPTLPDAPRPLSSMDWLLRAIRWRRRRHGELDSCPESRVKRRLSIRYLGSYD